MKNAAAISTRSHRRASKHQALNYSPIRIILAETHQPINKQYFSSFWRECVEKRGRGKLQANNIAIYQRPMTWISNIEQWTKQSKNLGTQEQPILKQTKHYKPFESCKSWKETIDAPVHLNLYASNNSLRILQKFFGFLPPKDNIFCKQGQSSWLWPEEQCLWPL